MDMSRLTDVTLKKVMKIFARYMFAHYGYYSTELFGFFIAASRFIMTFLPFIL